MNQVLQLAQLYGSSDTAPADAYQNAPAVQGSVLAPDPLQAELDEARAAVTKADAAYRVALEQAETLAHHGQELTDRADGTGFSPTGWMRKSGPGNSAPRSPQRRPRRTA